MRKSLVKKAAVGVDIGGTSVKLGLVSGSGKVVARSSFPTESHSGRSKMLKALVGHILGLDREAKRRGFRLSGVGVGAPGPIDVRRGRVYFFPNVPGWKNTPLKAILQRRLRRPVWLDNDAGAAALGEFCFGAGRGSKSMIALTLGTGIGGGWVLDGRLFHGPAFSATEIGHVIIHEDGPLCACGNRGCVETYVGNHYFVAEVRKRLKQGARSVLKQWIRQGKELSPLLVAQAARKGDSFSKKFWLETGEHLGTVLAGLCNVLNPDRVILGGGIAQTGRLILDPVTAAIGKKAFSIAARSVKVMPAKLGMDAGLVGAAALVFSNQKGAC